MGMGTRENENTSMPSMPLLLLGNNKLKVKVFKQGAIYVQSSNLELIDFHPNLDILFYSPPLDPFLLSTDSYYFEHGLAINGSHMSASACCRQIYKRGKESRSQTLLTSCLKRSSLLCPPILFYILERSINTSQIE